MSSPAAYAPPEISVHSARPRMLVVTCLPRALERRISDAAAHRHLVVDAGSWDDLPAAIQRERTDVVVVDPQMRGGDAGVRQLVRDHRFRPLLVYTTPTPTSMQLIADLASRGLPARNIIVRGVDDADQRLLSRLSDDGVSAIDVEARKLVSGALVQADERLRRSVLALFEEPHRYRRVEDLCESERLARRTVLRMVRLAGFRSVHALLVAAHLLRAHRYLQDHTATLESVAEKLGHPGPRTICRNFEEVTGRSPSRWRRTGTDEQMLECLKAFLFAQ